MFLSAGLTQGALGIGHWALGKDLFQVLTSCPLVPPASPAPSSPSSPPTPQSLPHLLSSDKR
ncbi:hypothetical protein LC609_17675 [Nostoc sp. XA013]|nr:hypothetical protein [Nostoc sp. XA013]